MPVTLTIKQVADPIAKRLRARAAGNHRSLQGELMAILEAAVARETRAEQPQAGYGADRKLREVLQGGSSAQPRMTIQELWELGKKEGFRTRSDSTRIIRKARDERYGR